MTTTELKELINSLDPKNAEYIIFNEKVQREFRYVNYCERNGSPNLESAIDCLKEAIKEFDSRYLTPANVKVGDGATVNYWSDRHAGTIVKVTKCSITIQRDKAILSPDFKPEFIPGGFAAHCINQDEQSYTYERNPEGERTTLRWSKVYNQYGQPGDLTASKGRHEYYDYNF